MSKATKKKSKIKFLGKQLEIIQSFKGQEADVRTIHQIELAREGFLKQLKMDGLHYLLNFKGVKTRKEVAITLEILKVLLQYDILLSEVILDEEAKWMNEERENKIQGIFEESYL